MEKQVSESMDIPVIGQPIVDGIFNDLSVMEVHLDANPLSYGPARLNCKVAEARGMLTDCESIFLRVSLGSEVPRSSKGSSRGVGLREKESLYQ